MPIQEHLEAYIASLRSDGRAEVYITRQESRIQKISSLAGFTALADIELTEVQQTINNMRTGKDKRPFSATTRKHWIQAIKGFTSWLTRSSQRLPADPLVALKRPSGKRDRRLVRRALLVEEWQIMKALLPTVGTNRGIEAQERLLVYELAIQTGLRASEIHSLQRANLQLTGENPTVVVPSDITKDARDANQPVTAVFAAKLRDHVATRTLSGPVFKMPRLDAMARMIREDVEAISRIWFMDLENNESKQELLSKYPSFLKVCDERDQRIDFHALRHTCGAWLALSGVHAKTI